MFVVVLCTADLLSEKELTGPEAEAHNIVHKLQDSVTDLQDSWNKLNIKSENWQHKLDEMSTVSSTPDQLHFVLFQNAEYLRY